MYAREEMNDTETRLTAIPIDFVVEQGLKERTEAKRRPYRTLITTWAEHEGRAEQGEVAANRLNTGNELERLKDLQNLPNSISPKFRKGEKAEQLVMIVREINAKVENDENWTWALVMKVMMDAKIIMTNVPNKFDALICWMIPGKGKDNVRKSGNYCIIDEKRHWRDFCDMPNINYDEYMDREV